MRNDRGLTENDTFTSASARLRVGTIVYVFYTPQNPGKVIASLPAREYPVGIDGHREFDFFVRVRWLRKKNGEKETELPENHLAHFDDLIEGHERKLKRHKAAKKAVEKL